MLTRQLHYFTAAEWADRLRSGLQKAVLLLPMVEAVTAGPGEAVLALLFAARSICEQYPEMPEFRWYADQVQKVTDKRDAAVAKARREASS